MRINSAARFACAPDWSWDTGLVPMPDRDLWVVLGGRGSLERRSESGSETHHVQRGDVFLLDGSSRIVATHDPASPLHVVAVHFEGGRELPFHARIAPVEFLAGVLERILRARLRGDGTQAVRWLAAALDEIGSFALDADRSDAPHMLVMAFADEIRSRPGDRWRVSTLAARAGLSPQYLGRLFREATGKAPKEYVLEARLEAARAYLRGSSLPIKRIATELGFHDEFHFSRQFRRLAGTSPSAYRAAATTDPR